MGDPQKAGPAAGKWRQELRNHPVIRVAGAYCVTAWLLMQMGEIILPSFDAPAWIMQALIATLVAGLPVVVILARLTRLPALIGLAEPPTPVAFHRRPDPAEEAGDILRLKSASLAVPMDLSESRQVTTMVCSLQGLLRGREDPETLLGFLAGIEEDIAQAISRYEGTRMPSGRNEIVVAFGFPLAHEDDARRAARLSRELLDCIRAHDIADGPDTRVISRAGLHSATIIIDEGAGDADVMSLLGDTVGVAGFLQAQVAEGETALSEETRLLLRSGFMLGEVSRQDHPRLGQGVPIYQLGRELTGELANVMAEHSEIFGRDHEHSLLMEQWRTVLEGESEYVLIKGEPGMGKTSLLFNAVKELVAGGEAQLMLLSCEPYYRESPFRPLINFFERSVFEGKRLSPAERFQRLQEFVGGVLEEGDEEAVPLLAALVSNSSEDGVALATNRSSKQVREKTLALLVTLMERFSARKPLVLAVEDLHWADPSTRDLIESLLAYDPSTPILGLFTARPEFEPAWANLPDVIEINLNKLPARVAAEVVREQAGEEPLAPEVVQQIIDHAGGIPLYIEQLTRSLLESRRLGEQGEGIAIPSTLKASLSARIDHLGPAKPLLQLCSVLGFEFSYELLRAVCEDSKEKLLRQVLGSIVNAGLIYQKGAFPEATFKFKHRLIMEVASQSLLRRTRQRLHQAIADKLESDFPEICETRPTQVAHHFSRAGNAPRAIGYWIRAAQLFQAKFANQEALSQVQRGLASLKDVQDPEQRDQFEITLQNLMGMIRLATRGYTNPEVRVAFERALQLSDKVEQSPALFKMIVGLWMYYLIRGEYDRALELADQLLRLAQAIDAPPEYLQANYCAGYSRYYRGDIPGTLEYFRRALAYIDSEGDFSRQTPSGDDTRPHLLCMYALALWSHGDPRGADEALQQSLAMAREHGQPYGLTWVLFFSTWLQHMRGKRDQAAAHAGEMIDICQERGFSFFIPLGMFFRASALEGPQERIEAMQQAFAIVLAAGARSGSAYLRALIVGELIGRGELDRAEELALENSAYIETQGEWLYSSENLRMQARLAQEKDGDVGRAECILQQAIEQAREVHNLPFALSCALSLHALPGREHRALQLLDEVLACYASADNSEDYQHAVAIVNEATKCGLLARGVSL